MFCSVLLRTRRALCHTKFVVKRILCKLFHIFKTEDKLNIIKTSTAIIYCVESLWCSGLCSQVNQRVAGLNHVWCYALSVPVWPLGHNRGNNNAAQQRIFAYSSRRYTNGHYHQGCSYSGRRRAGPPGTNKKKNRFPPLAQKKKNSTCLYIENDLVRFWIPAGAPPVVWCCASLASLTPLAIINHHSDWAGYNPDYHYHKGKAPKNDHCPVTGGSAPHEWPLNFSPALHFESGLSPCSYPT